MTAIDKTNEGPQEVRAGRPAPKKLDQQSRFIVPWRLGEDDRSLHRRGMDDVSCGSRPVD